LTVLAILAFAGGAAAGYFALRDSGAVKGNDSGSGVGDGVQVASVKDFDPEGTGTPGENPGQVANVTDGDASTTWSTEHYNSRDFGGAKSGVGLVLTLTESAEVSAVEVDATEGGWSAEIYVGDGSAETLDGWGSAVGSVRDAGTSARIDTDPTRGDAVLVWFTRLPASGKLRVAEVRVA